MRRPSPLPAPERDSAIEDPARDQRSAREDPAVRVPAQDRGDPGDVAPRSDDDTATAPIPVIGDPDASLAPAAPDVDATGAVAEERGDSAPGEKVGLREVWRAARARRRALTSEVRRFTVRQRRRRAIWLGSIAAVVLMTIATVGAAYSPLFAVESVTVVGAQQVDADEVASALSTQVGTPLPLIDDSEIKAALVGFPLIESYTVEARPPHELVVRIVERTPIGVIESSAGFTLVDAAGVALSTTQSPAAGQPVLVVTGGVDSEAFDAAGMVIRSLPPEIMAQVTEVAATTPNDVTLTLGSTGTRIVWGSAEDSPMKALVLSTTMLSRPPGTVLMYDVSSPEAIVIQ